MNPRIEFDKQYLGKKYILGIDEVGWGCVAGPVVLGACLIPIGFYQNFEELEKSNDFFADIKDSKKVNEYNRGVLYEKILSYTGWEVKTGSADVSYINKNRLALSYTKAFDEIISHFEDKVKDAVILVDGNRDPKSNLIKNVNLIVKGDDKSFCIGVASLYAKEFRDQYMRELEKVTPRYSNYQFHKNKGYGTSEHANLIRQFGLSDEHREEASKKLILK